MAQKQQRGASGVFDKSPPATLTLPLGFVCFRWSQVAAALESVFPRIGLKSFIMLTTEQKVRAVATAMPRRWPNSR